MQHNFNSKMLYEIVLDKEDMLDFRMHVKAYIMVKLFVIILE